jgi:GMP synthase (glutamine-hydrolysing)
MKDHCGAIIFGGPMSANDGDDYIAREIDWIKVPLLEEKPLLGICLGAQMLAKHLGAEVYTHREGRVEVGYEPIAPKEEGRRLGDWPSHVYHWHGEGFTLASGAIALAGGEVFENQAFRYGRNAYGVQFHPEITLAMIHRWTVRGSRRLSQPGAQPPADHIKAHALYGGQLRAWTFNFLDRMFSSREEMAGEPALAVMTA